MLTMPIQEQLSSRYNGKHAAWISSMRITCIAVTNVTANPKASAVRLISGALPGIMPTASDSHGIPSHVPSAQAASAVAIIEPLSSTSTLARKPGARRKKLRSKAAPQRCSNHTEPNANTSVNSTAVTISPRCATTCCITDKVKWQPMATATINCPASRPWGICGTIAPLHRLINTASNEPMLVFDNTFLQRHLLDAFCSNDRVRSNIALESNFVPLVIAATRNGMGVSTLLRSVQQQEPGLAGVSFEPAQFMHFNLCWRGSEYLSQANRRFIETAKVYFQEDASSPLSH